MKKFDWGAKVLTFGQIAKGQVHILSIYVESRPVQARYRSVAQLYRGRSLGATHRLFGP
jgi:hypothetical protein